MLAPFHHDQNICITVTNVESLRVRRKQSTKSLIEVAVFWIVAPCSLVVGNENVSEAVLPPSSGFKYMVKEMYRLHSCLSIEVRDT